MGGGEKANLGLRSAEPLPFAEEDAEAEALMEGATGRCGAADDEEGTGTCWKARVTS